MPPNNPSSATAATRRADGNRDGPPPLQRMVRPRAHFKNLGSFISKYVPRTTATVTNDATAAAMAHLEVARRGVEKRESSMDVVPDRTAATGKGKHIANS